MCVAWSVHVQFPIKTKWSKKMICKIIFALVCGDHNIRTRCGPSLSLGYLFHIYLFNFFFLVYLRLNTCCRSNAIVLCWVNFAYLDWKWSLAISSEWKWESKWILDAISWHFFATVGIYKGKIESNPLQSSESTMLIARLYEITIAIELVETNGNLAKSSKSWSMDCYLLMPLFSCFHSSLLHFLHPNIFVFSFAFVVRRSFCGNFLY